MFDGIFTAIGTLILVGAILYLAFFTSRRIGKGMAGRNSSQYMKTIDQLVFAQDKSVVLMQIGEKYYFIGISPSQISMLAELTKDEIIPLQGNIETNGPELPDFKELMMRFGNRKNRKK